jgi:hypothetical protein
MIATNGRLPDATAERLEAIDLTPRYRGRPSRRRDAVLEAAATVAAAGREPTARAVAEAMGDAGPAEIQAVRTMIGRLKDKGQWPYPDPPRATSGESVLAAADRIAAGGPYPGPAAIVAELGLDAPTAVNRIAATVSHLRRVGRWPHGYGRPGRPPAAAAAPGSSAPPAPPRPRGDAEMEAIARCVEAIGALDPAARRRAWRYLADRFAADAGGAHGA